MLEFGKILPIGGVKGAETVWGRREEGAKLEGKGTPSEGLVAFPGSRAAWDPLGLSAGDTALEREATPPKTDGLHSQWAARTARLLLDCRSIAPHRELQFIQILTPTVPGASPKPQFTQEKTMQYCFYQEFTLQFLQFPSLLLKVYSTFCMLQHCSPGFPLDYSLGR